MNVTNVTLQDIVSLCRHGKYYKQQRVKTRPKVIWEECVATHHSTEMHSSAACANSPNPIYLLY